MKIEITNLGMNGEGVGNCEGKIIFVNNALPDETVECEIVKNHDNYAIAKLLNIIVSSPNRVEPYCPYYSICGGCELQHMNYKTQLEFKQTLVSNTLKKVGNIPCQVSPTIECDSQFNYRNKITFSCIENEQGFKQKATNKIVDVQFCPLANDNINKTFGLVKEYLANFKIRGIKNIVIRTLENKTLIAIVTKTKQNLFGLLEYLKSKINNFGLFNVVNKRNDSVVFTKEIYHVGGLKNIKLLNPKFELNIESFYQTNLNIQTKLYNHILAQINKQDYVINGYSGAGLLSAILAAKAKRVVGIEINKSSHLNAENLKKCNNISNLTNICGDFFENFKKLANNSFNTIVLDPSKKGCGKETMQAINGIEKIVYVSCNPIALAKDLREIASNYIITSIQPFDMFPNTTSVETCVTLIKKH